MRDITLRIVKTGDDGWCMRSLALYVNSRGTPLYKKDWGSAGKWLDSASGYSLSTTIGSDTLRAYKDWRIDSSAMYSAPTYLSRTRLQNQVEGVIGDMASNPSSKGRRQRRCG